MIAPLLQGDFDNQVPPLPQDDVEAQLQDVAPPPQDLDHVDLLCYENLEDSDEAIALPLQGDFDNQVADKSYTFIIRYQLGI